VTLVDTNVLIYLITDSLPAHGQHILSIIEQSPAGKLYVRDAVLAEVCTVLEFNQSFTLPRPLIHRALIQLLINQPAFTVSETAIDALELYHKHAKLDFVDCLLIAEAKGAHDVLSFDKQLLKILEK
jgi:predicted nucleic-acid-binding protein